VRCPQAQMSVDATLQVTPNPFVPIATSPEMQALPVTGAAHELR
jgi:hypothetical protein